MASDNENPIVTIGLPVYNGEKFIQEKLESLKKQTLRNYELIISDNASSDKTSEICKEFVKKDSRIKYFRQENNIEGFENFYFVLNKAMTKYFVWSAVDDFMLPNFVEANVRILEKNKKYVGSISKIKYFDDNDSILNKKEFPYDKYPFNSTYEKRVNFYLRMISAENMYAVFRTNPLKKCRVKKMIAADDAIVLKILKFGDIFVSDNSLLYRYDHGMSQTKDLFKRIKNSNGNGILGLVFPFLPFTNWCLKNLGIKIFLKNLDFFYKINWNMQKTIILTLMLKLKNNAFRKNKQVQPSDYL